MQAPGRSARHVTPDSRTSWPTAPLWSTRPHSPKLPLVSCGSCWRWESGWVVARCGGGGAAARAPALARVLAAGLRGGPGQNRTGRHPDFRDRMVVRVSGVPRVAGDGVPQDRARYSPLPLKAPGGFGFRAFSLPAAARTISFTAADRKHRASNLKGEGSDPASTPGFVQPRSGESQLSARSRAEGARHDAR
jgi:hypothetical protein